MGPYTKDIFVCAALTGVAAYAGEMAFGSGGSLELPIIGRVSAPVALGATSAVAAGIAEAGKNYVAPYLGKFGPMAAGLTAPILTGAADVGLLLLTEDGTAFVDFNGYLKTFGIGAGAYIAGEYAAQTLLGIKRY